VLRYCAAHASAPLEGGEVERAAFTSLRDNVSALLAAHVTVSEEHVAALQLEVARLREEVATQPDVTRECERLVKEYNAKCVEYDAKCVDYDVQVDEARKFQREVELMSKEKEACLKAVKHWQAEAASNAESLVAALSSRDAVHLKLYTVSVELAEKEKQVGEMQETLKVKEHAETFAHQVCGLAKVFASARQACDPALDLLGECASFAASPTPADGDEKGKKKKRKSKKKSA
jgi:hypothetical protein